MCVGFLYTLVVRRPFESLITVVSRKGMLLSFSVSMVKRIVGCWLLRCCKKPSTWSRSNIVKVLITAMVLVDLSKAFYSLCHSNLLNKLTNLGISNKACLWFKSYLTNRQQYTRISTSLSEPLTVTHGYHKDQFWVPCFSASI